MFRLDFRGQDFNSMDVKLQPTKILALHDFKKSHLGCDNTMQLATLVNSISDFPKLTTALLQSVGSHSATARGSSSAAHSSQEDTGCRVVPQIKHEHEYTEALKPKTSPAKLNSLPSDLTPDFDVSCLEARWWLELLSAWSHCLTWPGRAGVRSGRQ